MMRAKYLKLYSTNIPVRGATRGAFYILDENKIELVPLDLIEIVELLSEYSIEECRNRVDSIDIFEEYISFLIDKRIGFITDTPEEFAEISFCYETPSHVFLSCISIDASSSYCFKSFVEELDINLCKHVELRLLHENISIKQITQVLDVFTGTTIRSIDLHIRKILPKESLKIQEVLKKYQKLAIVVLYEMLDEMQDDRVIFKKRKFEQNMNKNFRREEELYINVKYFCESQEKNTFYNKKVAIDENGILRNDLICQKSYGRYCPTSNNISNLVRNIDFTKYWNVSPDNIEDIKDSEFRYAIFPAYEIKEVDGKFYFKKS